MYKRALLIFFGKVDERNNNKKIPLVRYRHFCIYFEMFWNVIFISGFNRTVNICLRSMNFPSPSSILILNC